ncbi:MAG: hypothetical protein KAX16_00150 [Actinomycetia bacterium]|nr:hypothetical protein [Actinomycetes bacterium]
MRFKRNNSKKWRPWKTKTKSVNGYFPGKAGSTYYFKVTAWDGAGNSNTSKKKRTIVPYNENQLVLKRSGFKKTFSGAKSRYYKNSVRYSTARGDSITYRFKGKRVSLVSTRGPNRSKAKVYVDGRYIKTINAFSSKTRVRKILFSKRWRKTGTHSIKIVNQKTRGRGSFDIDGLAVGK